MLFDELDDLNLFLKENALWLALAGVFIILLAVFFIFLSGRKRKVAEDFGSLFLSLGGKDNILSAMFRGSRLTLQINDESKVLYDQFPKEIVSNYIKMTGKLILVVGEKSKQIADEINKKAD